MSCLKQKTGTARPSFTAKHLEAMYEQKQDPEHERAVRLGAAMIFAGSVRFIVHEEYQLKVTVHPHSRI